MGPTVSLLPAVKVRKTGVSEEREIYQCPIWAIKIMIMLSTLAPILSCPK